MIRGVCVPREAPLGLNLLDLSLIMISLLFEDLKWRCHHGCLPYDQIASIFRWIFYTIAVQHPNYCLFAYVPLKGLFGGKGIVSGDNIGDDNFSPIRFKLISGSIFPFLLSSPPSFLWDWFLLPLPLSLSLSDQGGSGAQIFKPRLSLATLCRRATNCKSRHMLYAAWTRLGGSTVTS